jgi:predicted small metal-binding protein
VGIEVRNMAKEIACRDAGYDCDFMIRDENESELIEFIQTHAKEAHDTDMSPSDIRGVWKTA